MELLQTMGLAFLGGLILNIMPCVLPVLTMKIFGLVEHSGASAAENRKQGMGLMNGAIAHLKSEREIVERYKNLKWQ